MNFGIFILKKKSVLGVWGDPLCETADWLVASMAGLKDSLGTEKEVAGGQGWVCLLAKGRQGHTSDSRVGGSEGAGSGGFQEHCRGRARPEVTAGLSCPQWPCGSPQHCHILLTARVRQKPVFAWEPADHHTADLCGPGRAVSLGHGPSCLSGPSPGPLGSRGALHPSRSQSLDALSRARLWAGSFVVPVVGCCLCSCVWGVLRKPGGQWTHTWSQDPFGRLSRGHSLGCLLAFSELWKQSVGSGLPKLKRFQRRGKKHGGDVAAALSKSDLLSQPLELCEGGEIL